MITLVSVLRSARRREESGESHRVRTPEERSADRRTAVTWTVALIAVPLVLVLLYTITR